MNDTRARSLLAAAVSNVGLVRTLNEDCLSVDGEVLAPDQSWRATLGEGPHLFLLADGMGGHAKGDVASRMVIDYVNKRAGELKDVASCLDVLRDANRHIYHETHLAPDRLGMGSTIVGVHLGRSTATWFNVGDSRVYRWRAGRLVQLSVDHVPHAGTGQRRASHAITQSMGGTYRPVDVWPSVGTADWLGGDRLLLCSDGLTDVLDDNSINQLLADYPYAEDAANALLEAVLRGGAPDNTTILVVTETQSH